MGLLAARVLDLDLPQADKRLLTIAETDGCFTTGIAVATNCWVNHRTLRIEDYGKVAATFVDTLSGRSIRISPHPGARSRAIALTPQARNHWEAMLLGYQELADDELLTVRPVVLTTPPDKLLSHAGRRVTCEICGEETMNEREVATGGKILCRACAGEACYYSNSGPGDEAMQSTAALASQNRFDLDLGAFLHFGRTGEASAPG